jgi:6-phosphogluconolactonase
MIPISEFATREAMLAAAAARIAEALDRAIAQHGAGCAALSGGGTPEPAYRAFASMPLDWQKVTFLQVDERFVPPSDDASNEKMLRRALSAALGAGARLLPMFAQNATFREAADIADRAYAGQRIGVAVLGMGEDGHTASWFPNSPDLDAVLDLNNARTVAAVHAPGAAGSEHRLTLTRSALLKADAALLLIAGEAKRDRLASSDGQAPVHAMFAQGAPGREVLWAP